MTAFGAFVYDRDMCDIELLWIGRMLEPYEFLDALEVPTDADEPPFVPDRKEDRRINRTRGWNSERTYRRDSYFGVTRMGASSKGYTLRSFRNSHAVGGHSAKRERRKLELRVAHT